jgi:tetratricopeptide (TPR) repeat protein
MNRCLVALFFACAVHAFAAQNPDSLRIGIHQLESEQHRWDDLKLVPGVGAFVHGKAYALSGDVKQAIVEFKKGVKKNKAAAYFNIGLAYFQLHNYPTAIQYFKKAERVRPDVLSRSYRQAATRIIKQQSKAHKK